MIAIIIDPRMAFGTGQHESTQLCLQMIEEIVEPGGRCLDFGTRSGILAIAAGRLGAGPVRALDTDPAAVLNARENLIRNGIPSTQVQVSKGSVDRVSGERFELILGNIQSSVLRPLLSAIRGCLGGGGPGSVRGGWARTPGLGGARCSRCARSRRGARRRRRARASPPRLVLIGRRALPRAALQPSRLQRRVTPESKQAQ